MKKHKLGVCIKQKQRRRTKEGDQKKRELIRRKPQPQHRTAYGLIVRFFEKYSYKYDNAQWKHLNNSKKASILLTSRAKLYLNNPKQDEERKEMKKIRKKQIIRNENCEHKLKRLKSIYRDAYKNMIFWFEYHVSLTLHIMLIVSF